MILDPQSLMEMTPQERREKFAQLANAESKRASQDWDGARWHHMGQHQANAKKAKVASPLQDAILNEMRRIGEPCLIPPLARTLGVTPQSAQEATFRLETKGLVRKTGERGPRGAYYWVVA